jgi:hypothetical protein
VLIVLKPRVQVKDVVHAAPAKLEERDAELGQQGNADAEVFRRLFFREAARRR